MTEASFQYGAYRLDGKPSGPEDPDAALDRLKLIFPTEAADDLNFCLFGTGGVHGTAMTIEDVKDGGLLTVLVVRPRLVCLQYGNVYVRAEDRAWLKKLRATSSNAVASIGWPAGRT